MSTMLAFEFTASDGNRSASFASGWRTWKGSGAPSCSPSRNALNAGDKADEICRAGDQVKVSVSVAVEPSVAFQVFTEEIDLWWRSGLRFRVAGKNRGIIHLEPRVGGRLFESFETHAGTRVFVTGNVTAWEPPARLVFEWRGVNFAPGEKTEVEVTFERSGDETVVTVVHRGWSAIRGDHPVRHGLDVAGFLRMNGLWWGDLMSSFRLRTGLSRQNRADYFLTTERLGFRTWKSEDIGLAQGLWGDPAVARFIYAGGAPSLEAIQKHLARELALQTEHGFQYWPIFLLANGSHVGCCGLRPHQPREDIYELGVHIRPAFWRKGFAFEAAKAVIDYAFEVLHARGLFAGHNPTNDASKQMIAKLGFRYTHEEFYPPTGLQHPSYLLMRSSDRPPPTDERGLSRKRSLRS